jgi:hypothetical protein
VQVSSCSYCFHLDMFLIDVYTQLRARLFDTRGTRDVTLTKSNWLDVTAAFSKCVWSEPGEHPLFMISSFSAICGSWFSHCETALGLLCMCLIF